MGALFAEGAQVDAGPGAEGSPELRDGAEGVAGPVPLGDLGVEPAFVAGQHVYLRALDGQFSTDPDWLNSQFALPGRSLPEHPNWQPFVYADKCGALETQTGCFVPFQALRRS